MVYLWFKRKHFKSGLHFISWYSRLSFACGNKHPIWASFFWQPRVECGRELTSMWNFWDLPLLDTLWITLGPQAPLRGGLGLRTLLLNKPEPSSDISKASTISIGDYFYWKKIEIKLIQRSSFFSVFCFSLLLLSSFSRLSPWPLLFSSPLPSFTKTHSLTKPDSGSSQPNSALCLSVSFSATLVLCSNQL